MTWIIEDWTSNHVYRDKQFNSYEEARDFISGLASEEALQSDGSTNEEIYDGVCEDLYAVERKDK